MITQPMAVYAAASAVAALLLSAIFTRIFCVVAPKLGLVDCPDAKRKLHSQPVPVGGGLAIFLSLCLVAGANFILPNPWGFRIAQDWFDLVILIIACGWLVVVGLYDDRYGLRGRYKLIAQILAAAIVVGGGYSFSRVNLFGISLDLGGFGPLLALLWFLGTINAINLLDGMDGQAGTLTVIFSATIAIMACLTGHYAVAFVALLLAAATLGFLRYNLPPARIFLGDSGSLFIGLLLGVLAMRASLKGPSTLLLASVVLLWCLPMFDTTAAILRRKLSGRSIYAGDREHLHHQFMKKLGSNVKALWLVAGLALVTASVSIVSVAMGSDLLAVACGLGVLAGLVTTGLFGRTECRLVLSTGIKAARRVKNLFGYSKQKVICEGLQLSGQIPWQTLWEQLLEPAAQYNLAYARIDLNDPNLRESYVGEWVNGLNLNEPKSPLSHHTIPLWANNREVGVLEAILYRSQETFQRDVEFVLSLSDPFEARLEELQKSSERQTSDQREASPAQALVTATSRNSGSEPINICASSGAVSGNGKKGTDNSKSDIGGQRKALAVKGSE